MPIEAAKDKNFYSKFKSEYCSSYHHKFFGHLIEIDTNQKSENGKIMCQISLVTMEFIDFEIEALEDKKRFHPYFTELIADVAICDYMAIKNKCIDGNWVKVELFKTECKTYKESKLRFKGDFIFGASPLKRRSVYFIVDEIEDAFIKNKLNKYKNLYYSLKTDLKDNISKIAIVKELYEDIKSVNSVRGTVYNVGQANCIELNFTNNAKDVSVMFDVGMSVLEMRDTPKSKCCTCIDKNWKTISKIKPEWVLLSHWDIDHILGICELDNDSYSIYEKTKWIAPDLFQLSFYAVSVSALRLCGYLFLNSKIALIKSGIDVNAVLGVEDKASILYLFTGKGCKGESSKNNNIGLCMEISYQSQNSENVQRALLPGDCEYKQFIGNVTEGKLYDFLVASHHGSNNSKECDVAGKENSVAVICTGKNNYGHPGDNHIKKLQANGFVTYKVSDWYGIRFEMGSDKEKVKVEFMTNYL